MEEGAAESNRFLAKEAGRESPAGVPRATAQGSPQQSVPPAVQPNAIAQSAAGEGQGRAAPGAAAGGVLESDGLNRLGKPYTSRLPALNAARQVGEGHEVVAVPGGYAVRRAAAAPVATNVEDSGLLLHAQAGDRPADTTPSPSRAPLQFSQASRKSPQDFVPSPEGGLDYGEITPEMGKAMRRQGGVIRLQQGVQNADGTGYGLVHIEANHGKQIRALGFGDVQSFVAHVAHGIQQVWQVPGNRQLLVTMKDGRKDVMYLQLEAAQEGDFYRVNSAFPVRQQDYEDRRGMKKIWDGSEPTSAVTGQRPAYATAASASPELMSSQGSSNARGQDGSVPSTVPGAKGGHGMPLAQARAHAGPLPSKPATKESVRAALRELVNGLGRAADAGQGQAMPGAAAGGVLEGDLLNRLGKPYTSRLPALNAARQVGEGHEVVPVPGGYAVR
ncbi:MAG: hypothetical protein F9K35_19045, partial [Burkholderiaceae bacterium]